MFSIVQQTQTDGQIQYGIHSNHKRIGCVRAYCGWLVALRSVHTDDRIAGCAINRLFLYFNLFGHSFSLIFSDKIEKNIVIIDKNLHTPKIPFHDCKRIVINMV